jgi:hypothetical protein
MAAVIADDLPEREGFVAESGVPESDAHPGPGEGDGPRQR